MRLGITLLLAFSSLFAFGQQKIGYLFLDDIHQVSQFNPAFVPETDHIRIGLPSVYFQIAHEGPVLDDFVVQEDNKLKIDLGKLVEGLDEGKTRLGVQTEINYLNLGFGNENMYFQLSHSLRVNSETKYSKDLAEVLWFGNGPYVGQILDLSADFSFQSYTETALSFSTKQDNLTFGVRLKLLSGIADISMEDPRFEFETKEETFALAFNTDFLIRSSSVTNYQGLEKFGLNFNPESSLFSGNTGFGLDLGLTFEVSEDFTIGVSVLDLGTIKWDQNLETISSKINTEYEGILLDDLISIDDLDFSADIDTIEELLDIQKTEGQGYKTKLNTSYNLHASYSLNDKIDLGAALQYQTSRFSDDFNYSVWGNMELISFLSVGASLSGYQSEPINFGAHFTLKAGPVQLYAYTFNVESFFRPYNAKKSNGRVGLNLVF